jgi:kinesin family member 2/24
MDNIQICIKKRPLLEHENKEQDIVRIHDFENMSVDEMKKRVDLSEYTKQHKFNFDMIFNNTDNLKIYHKILCDSVKSGDYRNMLCFCYGQTGSGKTFTMLDQRGLVRLSALQMFWYCLAMTPAESGTTTANHPAYDLYMSSFEIYNEKIYDLMNKHKRLRMCEDSNKISKIVALSERKITSEEDVSNYIDKCKRYRQTGISSKNNASSRSHAIYFLSIKKSNTQQSIKTISFIDLAGSERAKVSIGDRNGMIESAFINQSLFSLKECIRALYEKKKYIPYRRSKLTTLLKNYLNFNSKIVMITTIAPGNRSSDATLNSLRYSQHMMDIKGNDKQTNNNLPKIIELSQNDHTQDHDVDNIYKIDNAIKTREDRMKKVMSKYNRYLVDSKRMSTIENKNKNVVDIGKIKTILKTRIEVTKNHYDNLLEKTI